MRIGYIATVTNDQMFPFKEFKVSAEKEGIEFLYVPITRTGENAENWPRFWTEVVRLAASADALYIQNGPILQNEQLVSKLHERIRQGTRAVVQLTENGQDSLNRFLAPFSITATRVRIRPPTGFMVQYKRSDNCFIDGQLLVGLDEVSIQQPNAIWYREESFPAIVGSERMAVIVADGDTDLPSEYWWSLKELSSMVAWYGPSGGAVLAISGSCLSDPYKDIWGNTLPGIRANERLAQNVMRFLAEGKPLVSIEDRFKRFEGNLGSFVIRTLEKADSQWWQNRVPAELRKKCEKRMQKEGSRFNIPAAYLDLSDLKKIIEANWAIFQSAFIARGYDGAMSTSLGWFDPVNELRRFMAHPLKRDLTGYSFSSSDQSQIKHADELALALVRAMV